MIRKAVPFALSSLLATCATLSNPAQPAPLAVDPRLCADVKPEPAVEGSIVAPVTDEERTAVEAHLTSDARSRDWGREGWARAALAKALCR